MSLNKTEVTENWFSKRVEKELKDLDSKEDNHQHITIAFALIFSLIILYLFAHQLSSTGFFTLAFGSLEMLLLYGSLVEWIVVAVLEAFRRKDLSRDIDAFGGIIFVTLSGVWLFAIFPFEFAYFANVLPDFLRFLVQWMSNDIGRVIIVLWVILNGAAAVYYGLLRIFVRQARAQKLRRK